jgi:hypothetical protein
MGPLAGVAGLRYAGPEIFSYAFQRQRSRATRAQYFRPAFKWISCHNIKTCCLTLRTFGDWIRFPLERCMMHPKL